MNYKNLIAAFVSMPFIAACTTDNGKTPINQAEQSSSTKLIDTYTAHISDKDKVDSNGVKLTDAQQIILQDRKNYYDFNIRDKGDTPSKVFASKESRWGEGKPISDMKWEPVNARKPEQGYKWNMRQGVEYEIIEGNPDVKIQIYNDGNIHVNPLDKYTGTAR